MGIKSPVSTVHSQEWIPALNNLIPKSSIVQLPSAEAMDPTKQKHLWNRTKFTYYEGPIVFIFHDIHNGLAKLYISTFVCLIWQDPVHLFDVTLFAIMLSTQVMLNI